uniref:Uncharacterized protein n=1 Tax=Arundo donax TaxID=35708 RepID=A0A0A9BEG4_ARUDO
MTVRYISMYVVQTSKHNASMVFRYFGDCFLYIFKHTGA